MWKKSDLKREEARLINRIYKKVGKTFFDYSLLNPDDKILIALSGGKDSLVLLESLVYSQKKIPFPIELIAAHIHVDNVGYKTNLEFMQSFCDYHGVPFSVVHFELENRNDSNKSTCFLCSWNRRKKLFELTKELGCNKLAFGHHLDDALETLFMNMVYHGSISSLPQKFSMFEGRIEVIRPLLNITEDELMQFAEIRNYPRDLKSCPHEDKTKRKATRALIDQFQELYPKAKINMFRAMDNVYPEYLPKNINGK